MAADNEQLWLNGFGRQWRQSADCGSMTGYTSSEEDFNHTQPTTVRLLTVDVSQLIGGGGFLRTPRPSTAETRLHAKDADKETSNDSTQYKKRSKKINKDAARKITNSDRLKNANIGIGYEIDGRWKLEEMIGEGGYGQVYRAKCLTSTGDAADVAIKIEPTDSESPQMWHEIECLRHLRASNELSPEQREHFLPLIADGTTPHVVYAIMQLGGNNLREIKRRTCSDRFSARATLNIGIQMLSALRALHTIGWMHRDIKPSNYCVRTVGSARVALIDFGLARCINDQSSVHSTHSSTRLTRQSKRARPNNFCGTTRYVSLNVHNTSHSTPKDDIWSVIYSLLEMHGAHLPWREHDDRATVQKMKAKCEFDKISRIPALGVVRQLIDDHCDQDMMHVFEQSIAAMRQDISKLDELSIDDSWLSTAIYCDFQSNADIKTEKFYRLFD